MNLLKRYEFGEFYYEFEIHSYTMPYGRVINTILMSSSNVSNTSDSDPILPNLIEFLANLCVEYETVCDSYHCRIPPYDSDKLEEIIDAINELASNKRQTQ